MASFATEGEGAADLFARPEFWKDSTLLDPPAPLARAFFDLVVKGWSRSLLLGDTKLTPTQTGPWATLPRSRRTIAISTCLKTWTVTVNTRTRR